MRLVKLAVCAAFLASAALVVPSIGSMGSAEAKAKKPAPGKCGAFMYYSKKKCLDARAKK